LSDRKRKKARMIIKERFREQNEEIMQEVKLPKVPVDTNCCKGSIYTTHRTFSIQGWKPDFKYENPL